MNFGDFGGQSNGFGGFQQGARALDPSKFICGAVVGCMITFGSLFLGGWNEYRNVATSRTISLGRDFHKPIACSPRDSLMDGKLVYLACPLTGQEAMGETTSGVPTGVRGIQLTSNIEAYGWFQERDGEDRNGNAQYRWVRRWSTQYSEGSGPGGGGDQTNPSLSSRSWYSESVRPGSSTIDTANAIKVGDFEFPDGLLSSVLTSEQIQPTCGANAAAPCPNGVTAQGSYLYYKYSYGTLGNDEPGDMRQTFTLGNAEFASVLAEQEPGGTLIPWTSPYDEDYNIFLADGELKTADELFQAAEDLNYALTWGLRVLSLILTIGGIFCIFSPISQVAEMIPCIGPMLAGLINTIICAVACAAGFMCWIVVVGCTWVIYRPWIGIPLLLAAMAITACLCFLGVQNAKKNQDKLEQVHGSGGGGAIPFNVTDPGMGFNNGGGGPPPAFNNGGGGPPPPTPGMNFCPSCGQMKPAEVPQCAKCMGFGG